MNRIVRYNAVVSKFFLVLVIVIGANEGSRLFWNLWLPQSSKPIEYTVTQQISDSGAIDYSVLRDYALFGVPPPAPVVIKPKPRPKPKRVLPTVTLTLLGIVALGEVYLAIISSGGAQETYAEGEYIGHVLIKKIGPEWAIVESDGREQKIFINQKDVAIGGNQDNGEANTGNPLLSDNASAQKGRAPDKVSQFRNEEVAPAQTVRIDSAEKKKLQQFKGTLATNPLQLLGKINTSPYREQGKIVGFQLTPGSEPQLFRALQLQPGDIIVQINGQDLSTVNNFATGMALMNKLSQLNTLDVVVRRRGELKRLYLNLQ